MVIAKKSRQFLIIFSYEAEFLPLLKYHFPNASEGRQHQSNEGQHHQVRIQLLRETMTIYHIHFDWHKPKKEPVADQKEAAIMTPAAKPIMMSCNLRLIFLKKKTMAEPTIVHPQVKRPARKAKKTTF